MFKELAPIVANTELHISIKTAENGKLEVMIIPKPKPGAHSALSKILWFTESPEELDEKLPALLIQYSTERLSLEETLSETSAYMAAAKQEAEKNAGEAVRKASLPSVAMETDKDETHESEEELAEISPGPGQVPADLNLFS